MSEQPLTLSEAERLGELIVAVRRGDRIRWVNDADDEVVKAGVLRSFTGPDIDHADVRTLGVWITGTERTLVEHEMPVEQLLTLMSEHHAAIDHQ